MLSGVLRQLGRHATANGVSLHPVHLPKYQGGDFLAFDKEIFEPCVQRHRPLMKCLWRPALTMISYFIVTALLLASPIYLNTLALQCTDACRLDIYLHEIIRHGWYL